MTNKQTGFTLVEMAIVLVISGLLLTAALSVGNAQLQSARISSTKQKQEAVRLALINYITRNNRLPCPAIAALAPIAAGYGAEAATPGTCTGTVMNGAVTTGIVPWRSLALSDENAEDGYYHRFTYQVALASTNTNPKTISGLKGATSTHSGTPVVMGPPATGNQTNDCTPSGGNYNPCSAVVVIVSHGNNGFGSYGRDGSQLGVPKGADELENANNDSKFIIKDFSDNTANPYDDIVFALTATDLLTPLTTHGSLGDYKEVINEDFTNIKNSIIAYAVANRTGSTGSYSYPIPGALPPMPLSGLKDPWGTLYGYGPPGFGISPINSSTSGSLPAFTLNSYGPDGVAGGNDDIQAVISVNQLQDAFAKAGW